MEMMIIDEMTGNKELKIYSNNMYINTCCGNTIIEAYLATLNNDNTVRKYRRSILDFFEYLYPNETLTSEMLIIDPVHAQSYRDMLIQKLNNKEIKTSTFNGKLKGCKQFYKWLMGQTTLNTKQAKLFNINPFDTVKQLAENDSEGSEPLTPDEVLLMLDNPVGENEHIRTRNMLILEIAISTGIRNDALMKITPDNITKIGDDWVLSVIDKNGKDALKPINNYHEQLMNWYEEDLRIRTYNNGTIFNIHPVSANRLIKEWAKGLKIDKKVTFHSLRTTTACQVFHLYDSVEKAQIVLQHTHMETTNGYLSKENRINKDAENIVKIMKGVQDNFEDIINSLSKEEIVKLLMDNMDTTSKMRLIKSIQG